MTNAKQHCKAGDCKTLDQTSHANCPSTSNAGNGCLVECATPNKVQYQCAAQALANQPLMHYARL